VYEHNLGGSWVHDHTKITSGSMEIHDFHILYTVLSQGNENMKHYYGKE